MGAGLLRNLYVPPLPCAPGLLLMRRISLWLHTSCRPSASFFLAMSPRRVSPACVNSRYIRSSRGWFLSCLTCTDLAPYLHPVSFPLYVLALAPVSACGAMLRINASHCHCASVRDTLLQLRTCCICATRA